MIDFEIAVINSINAVFPRAEIKGCFFHLCQNVYRKVQALGLQQLYQNDTNFAIQVRMIAALAFVPLDKVIEHFENLQEHFIDAVSPVLDYFEDTYIGRCYIMVEDHPSLPTICGICMRELIATSEN